MSTLHSASIASAIERLGPWFHNIHLPDGTQTAPNHFLGDFPSFKWQQISPHLPQDLRNWRVLDIGCNAGFYAIELAKRGAQVLGIDVDPHYLKQAQWVRDQFNLQHRIRFEQMQIYELAHLDETFDIVWFMGVFYHLRYPLLGLDIAVRKTQRMMVFQSLSMPGDSPIEPPEDMDIYRRDEMLQSGWPKMAFIEHKFANDPTNWWAPNPACIEAMLRSSGMRITAHPADETVICEPDPNRDEQLQQRIDAELRSATAATPVPRSC